MDQDLSAHEAGYHERKTHLLTYRPTNHPSTDPEFRTTDWIRVAPGKTNLLTKRNCEEVAAVECDYPQPACLLSCLPKLAAKLWFVLSLPLPLVGFYSREIAPIPEANRRDPVMIRCTTFCLISFYIKINSVLRILITHIIMVAASKVGATSLAIKYEPLKCDCKLTKQNEMKSGELRVGSRLKAQAIYFYEEEMTRNELRAVKKSFTCLTKTRLRFVVIFCTFGADYTGNLISWIHNLVSNTCYNIRRC